MDNRHSPPRFVPAISIRPLPPSRFYPPAPGTRAMFHPSLCSSSIPSTVIGFSIEKGSRANRSDDLANEIISPGEKFRADDALPVRNSISMPLADPTLLNFEHRARDERVSSRIRPQTSLRATFDNAALSNFRIDCTFCGRLRIFFIPDI